ncbi:MAG: FISUMP domain-containing protein, partial [Bacteroidota bacterium]
QTFMYFEASLDYTDTDNAILLSPFYDLRKKSKANVAFHYHMYGKDMGSLKLEVSTDKGQTWVSLFSVEGQQQSSGTAAWKSKEVDLEDYLNKIIQLRFIATGKGKSRSDISIDNVTVSASAPASPSLLIEPGEMITDVEGNTYHTVTIGKQTWMAENLRTSTCNDGTTKLSTIKVADSKSSVKLNATPGIIWHKDDKKSDESLKYGPLYNWQVVSSSGCKVCPQGWRIPTYKEWQTLIRTWYFTRDENAVLIQPDVPSKGAGLEYAGRQLRAKDDSWEYSSTNTNTSGFSALPGGWLWNGRFSYLNKRSAWWAPNNGSPRCAKIARGNHGTWMSAAGTSDVLYIRCIKE